MANDLPNFLIVGGAKCGTTSIANYLNSTPGIFIPTVKEPHFFVADKLEQSVQTLVPDFEDYKKLFSDSDDQLRGEASVFYLYHYKIAIPRILDTLGAATRIIIVIRNPVERAFSAYNYTRALNSFETLEFEAALDAEQSRLLDERISPMLHYTSVGKYPAMIRAYLDAFPNCQIELFDDIKSDTVGVVNRLERFLGVAETARTSLEVHNRGGLQWKYPAIAGIIKGISHRSKFLKDKFPWLRTSARKIVERTLFSKAESLSANLRLRLENEFRGDIDELSKLVGRDLDHWFSSPTEEQAFRSGSVRNGVTDG